VVGRRRDACSSRDAICTCTCTISREGANQDLPEHAACGTRVYTTFDTCWDAVSTARGPSRLEMRRFHGADGCNSDRRAKAGFMEACRRMYIYRSGEPHPVRGADVHACA
jgi:hypothetical protein